MPSIAHNVGRLTASVLRRIGAFDFAAGFALEAATEPVLRQLRARWPEFTSLWIQMAPTILAAVASPLPVADPGSVTPAVEHEAPDPSPSTPPESAAEPEQYACVDCGGLATLEPKGTRPALCTWCYNQRILKEVDPKLATPCQPACEPVSPDAGESLYVVAGTLYHCSRCGAGTPRPPVPPHGSSPGRPVLCQDCADAEMEAHQGTSPPTSDEEADPASAEQRIRAAVLRVQESLVRSSVIGAPPKTGAPAVPIPKALSAPALRFIRRKFRSR